MPSDFKVYSGANVEHVGVPIAVVSTDQPAGTNALRVKWYLFIQSHADAMTRQGSGTIVTTTQAAAVADPIQGAFGFIENAFMVHQAQLQEKSGRPENSQEIEFSEIHCKIFNTLWFQGAGRDEIASVRDATQCAPLRHFLFSVCEGPAYKRNTESPYPEQPKPNPELNS